MEGATLNIDANSLMGMVTWMKADVEGYIWLRFMPTWFHIP